MDIYIGGNNNVGNGFVVVPEDFFTPKIQF